MHVNFNVDTLPDYRVDELRKIAAQCFLVGELAAATATIPLTAGESMLRAMKIHRAKVSLRNVSTSAIELAVIAMKIG